MSQIDEKIRLILQHIKDNPRCNTNELEGQLVDDLYQQGRIEGINVKNLSSTAPEYIELRLTIDGERELERLSRPWYKSVWLSIPARWVAGILALVLAAAFIHYLGIG